MRKIYFQLCNNVFFRSKMEFKFRKIGMEKVHLSSAPVQVIHINLGAQMNMDHFNSPYYIYIYIYKPDSSLGRRIYQYIE